MDFGNTRINQDDGPLARIKGFFGRKRKNYAEIMKAFVEAKTDLKKLVDENDADILEIEEEIAALEQEKADVVVEKTKAVDTLEFLDKMVKE
ncbi:hypothetical protein JZU46_00920 [bacterium]|nr:hypothetical protein [bacterium]